jgi:glycosyltransferase involved in cell wall biosynthesis/uncharacterized membrane protein
MRWVTVIIPTHNSAATIERCLQSVQSQTYPQVEILVVDNGSRDETVAIAERYARVISGGSERSEQVNLGADQARGAYLYRIDDDFELDPGVIAACVAAIEEDGADIVAIPNRSAGGSFWARVRRLERDTYLDDTLIVAARFWRREAFESVGGFDESLVSCEDYDLHNRMLAAGYRLGRIDVGEIHLGEPDTLWENAVKSFYYGPSAWRYVRKHPSRGARQMFPIRPSYLRHWRDLVHHPGLSAGLLILKGVQYSAAGLAILLTNLGFISERGQLVPSSVAALILVLAALAALVTILPDHGVTLGTPGVVGVVLAGLVIWLSVGRRRARMRGELLGTVLPGVALAYVPFLLLAAAGPSLTGDVWLIAFTLTGGGSAAWLVLLSEPAGGKGRRAAWVTAVAVALFVLLFTWRAIQRVETRQMSAYDIAVYDQALWATAHGVSGGDLLLSSIHGESLLAQVPAPILLFYLPAYRLGLGGPLLLMGSHVLALGLAAAALYRLINRRLGQTPAVVSVLAFLVYFGSLRLAEGGFRVETLGAALILWAIDALESDRPVLAYLLLALAVACGVESSLAVAGVGLALLVTPENRWHGGVTLGLGLAAAWVLSFVLVPYFGGSAGGPLGMLAVPAGRSWLEMVAKAAGRPEALRYLLLLLFPLAFVPLAGAGWLLPALPGLLLNLIRGHLGAAGPAEALISPFLFIATAHGLARMTRRVHKRGRPAMPVAGSALILVSCLLSTRFLDAGLLATFGDWRSAGEARGEAVLARIPERASLAVQESLAPELAHRAELALLPEVREADYLLFDRFDPVPPPQGELVEAALTRAVNSPAYGLRAAQDGMLLFERDLDPAGKADVVLAHRSEIQFPATLPISETVTYRGYSVSDARGRLDRPFVLTVYWESLAPVLRPYLIFVAHPGAQLFQEAGYGLRPVTVWEVGDLVAHQVLVVLPALPDGDGYEIVAGLWHDRGEPALSGPAQLLGEDVVRVATIDVSAGTYQVTPWTAGGNE